MAWVHSRVYWLLSLFGLLWPEAHCNNFFCWFHCPETSNNYMICAVDSQRGAKLFPDKCTMLKENHCQKTQYQEIEVMECLKRYPEAIVNFITANRYDAKFEGVKSVVGVRPLPRFMILMNFICRIAVTKPYLIPIMPTFGIPQLPLPMWPALV